MRNAPSGGDTFSSRDAASVRTPVGQLQGAHSTQAGRPAYGTELMAGGLRKGRGPIRWAALVISRSCVLKG